MSVSDPVGAFLGGTPFALAGASSNPAKFGNRILRSYLAHGLDVHPINPRETTLEGRPCYATLSAIPVLPHAVSIVTPPEITEDIVREALALGIGHIWMQPGAESDEAVDAALEAGVNLLWGGPCILVELPRRLAST